ncbi:MAG: carbon-nitrogen hydrolase family protein [Rubrobacteraceae bacterium]
MPKLPTDLLEPPGRGPIRDDRRIGGTYEASREEAGLAQILRGDFGLHGVTEPPDTASVAALNLTPSPGAVERNLLLAEEAITEAKTAHPDLRWVVLPEIYVSGYTSLRTAHQYAEDAEEGPSVRRFSALARSLGIYIAYGFAERHPGTTGPSGISDSANLVGPEGKLLTYRKRHLVPETGEDQVFVPGVDLPSAEAGGLRVSLAICWDLGFPEVVREAAHDGTELILAPAGWRALYARQYELSCAARALDNGVYLASANQVGEYQEARFGTPGGVYGPDGRRISETTGNRSVGTVDRHASISWRSCYGNTLYQYGASPASLEACS